MTRAARRLPLAAWLAALALAAAVIAQARFASDMSAFMPRAPTARQQLLLDQLRHGIVARLVMIGIEGGDPPERARLSRALAAGLRAGDLFVGVQNGEDSVQERDLAYFFDNRYLLSPAVTRERFTAKGLHEAIADSLEALAGSAGLILKRTLARDPTGEALQVTGQFARESRPRSVEGAWASRDGRRALLLAQLRAPGSDIDAQARAIDAIRRTFEAIPGRGADTRLVLSGTSVFAVASRSTIEGEVSRLAAASIALVACLLLAVYRSFALLALGLLPVVSGALAGIAAVSLGFGQVHSLTLAFGTTLIGEAVDYSIYFFIQRSGSANPAAFWRTIRLGVLTSIAGFAALLWSDFPGLAQLGLYSITGLIAAALVTRYVLPVVIPQRLVMRDLSQAGIALDAVIGRAARLRWAILALLLAAGAVIALHAGSIWNRKLSALSPVSEADQRLDVELRTDMGSQDMRYVAAFTAPDPEAALQGAERTGAVLQRLTDEGTLGGFNSPALVLPSSALQRARQAALPDAEQARLRLARALEGLPIRAGRLEGFLSDLEAARTRAPLARTDLDGTSLALLADSLLVRRDRDCLVLLPLRAAATGPGDGTIEIDRVASALAAHGLADVAVIDLLAEATDLFDNYLHEALLLSGLGSLAIVGLLLISLRSVPRTLRVAVPLGCAVLCVTAGLLLAGVQLTILHLVGLLLVVAVGSNYALFFDSGALAGSPAERRRTQVSLVVANLTTVGSFGVLGLSKVPVLSAIGTTVGLGAFLALVFSAILARARTDADRR